MKEKASKVSVTVYIAIILFSMSTWMDVVGVWIEMPLFVTTLPEGWSLPSYLAIIIQLSNIGPAVYAVIQKWQGMRKSTSDEKKHRTVKRLDTEVVLTLIIIATAALNIFLLSFLWPTTAVIGGRRHSVVMLTQMVPTALTSCMTSLVFLPYMARFPSAYISAYYVGQGFSGLVPGVIGLIQGSGSPPQCLWNVTQTMNDTLRNATSEISPSEMMNMTSNVIIESQKPLFSVQIFFFCLTALFLVSLAAFCCLNFTSYGRSSMIGHEEVTKMISDKDPACAGDPVADAVDKTSPTNIDLPDLNGHQMCKFVAHATEAENEQIKSHKREELLAKPDGDVSEQSKETATTTAKMQGRIFAWLLVVIFVVNAFSNGLLPSTESYTCLPYGYLVYTLAVRLSSVAASLASLSTMFLPRASVKVVFILALLGLIIATFHMFLASQSPNPVLRGSVLGDIIVVSLNLGGQ